MYSEAELAQMDAMYRGIGRYVVEFAAIVEFMQGGLALQIEEGWIADLVLGEMSATQLANSFFAVCLHGLDDDEKAVGRSLRGQFIEEANRRNNVAHGNWMLGYTDLDGTIGPGALMRVKPAKRLAREIWSRETMTADKLEKWCDEVADLGQMIADFGHIALGIDDSRRVRDVLIKTGKKPVQRVGDQSPPSSASQ